MMIRTRARLVPFVLCTTGLVVACLTGCKPAEEESASSGSAPAIKVADPSLRAVADERAAATEVRDELAARMEKKLEAVRERLGTAGAAEVKAALEKDPEWQALDREFRANEARLAKVRAELDKRISK